MRSTADPRLKSAARRRCLVIVKARHAPCYRCGQPLNYSLTTGPWRWEGDEIIPRYLGGDPTDPANVVASHRVCNRREGAKIATALRKARRQGQPAQGKRAPRVLVGDW